MHTAATIVLMVLRVAGVIQLALGLLFWTGNARNLVELHMGIGFTLVLALWATAGLAARAGASPGLILLAVLWGIGVPILGITQVRLLPGDLHWLVQVAHLGVGLVALGLGERLATQARGRPAAAIPA